MDLSDSLKQRWGNPNLNPEFTHSFELGHQYQSKPLQLGTTAFFRYTTGQIFQTLQVNHFIFYCSQVTADLIAKLTNFIAPANFKINTPVVNDTHVQQRGTGAYE